MCENCGINKYAQRFIEGARGIACVIDDEGFHLAAHSTSDYERAHLVMMLLRDGEVLDIVMEMMAVGARHVNEEAEGQA